MSSISEAYGKFIEALNARDWDAASALLSDSIVVNGKKQPKSNLIDGLLGLTKLGSDLASSIDLVLPNAAGNRAFVRCIHRLTLSQDAFGYSAMTEPAEFLEHTFLHSVEGKLDKIDTITEIEGYAGVKTMGEGVKRVERLSVQPAPEVHDIKAAYEDYEARLNDRAVQDRETASKFLCDSIMHNGVEKSLEDSLVFLKGAAQIIEGQHFALKDVIVDQEKQQIATHAIITGTPRKDMYGIAPTGKSVEYPAIVFYQFDGGKIRQIYNMWDLKAYRRCLDE